MMTRPTAAPSGPSGVTSVAYPSFTVVPAGALNVLQTANAGNAIVSGTTLQEGNNAGTTTGGYNSVLVLPDTMAITTSVSVTVTVGARSTAANNRAVGGGLFSADGTKGVYIRFPGASGTATLCTWSGGVEAQPKTSTQTGTAGDTLTLTGTLGAVTAGVWTWTVSKNGGAAIAALSWDDASHVVDLPGNRPAAAFRHQYSGGQFPSRGVAALSATST